jgi:fucose permease
VTRVRPGVLVSYAAFVLVGINSGVSGVLLPSQMGSYGVDRAAIGITFFTSAAGFALAGFSTGGLIHRYSIRTTLTAGIGVYALAGLYLASKPPFAVFVLAQLVTGYGTGILESALNVYLAALPGATTLLNRLHAFFGVGALVGPLLAAWILGFASWTVVWLVLAGCGVPLVTGFLAAFPGPAAEAEPEPAAEPPSEARGAPGAGAARAAAPRPEGLLGAALRDRGVQLGAAMLAVYVGLEIGVGNWAFSYLVQTRGLPSSLASYAVSGYWLGLTLGRFLISPIATRFGLSASSMMYACLAGITVTAALGWLAPDAAVACVALGLLGFCLGPVFPTTMASTPRLTQDRLVPDAIGVINAASVGGGSVLPWLAGAIAQSAGMAVLMPFALVLGLAQFGVWRPIARRLRVR